MDPRYSLVALGIALCLQSCWTGPATSHSPLPPPPSPHHEKNRAPSNIVVVMTWDGVRWQEILNGIDPVLERRLSTPAHENRSPEALLPNLYALANTDGVLLGGDEAPIFASSSSTVSLPGYSEIFSGQKPWCDNNECPATKQPTLLDEWQVAHPNTPMAVITSWSRIPRVAARELSPISVTSGRTFVVQPQHFCVTPELCRLVETGARLSPWPGGDDYRPDRATAAIALAYLHAHTPEFAFIGLGDTDEYAHRGDYAGYLSALHDADETLGAVRQWLDAQRQLGHRTLLVVTADHGRSSGFSQHSHAPEAARVWALFAGSGVTARGHAIATASRLADIAPTIREFVGLDSDPSPLAGTSLASKLAPAGIPIVQIASR